jgi:cytochrome c oxidase subunit 2
VPALVLSAFALWVAAPALGQAAAPPTAGVKIDGSYGYWLPPDVSDHGHGIDRLIQVLHWFMAALFVGWGIFFVRCLMRYRQRPGHAAHYDLIKAKPAKYSEFGVMIFEVILLVGFSMPVWASMKNDLPTAADKPVRIRVLAEQFAWNFHYPGPDGVFGKTAPKFIDTAQNVAGLDPSDPAGKDDLVQGEFHIPVHEPIICDISSKDVIHSFFLPVMRIKQDAIPGMRIPVWFKTKAGSEGTYEVACAQLCGNNHYNMKALMVIESRTAFEAWVKKKSEKIEFEEE